MIREELIEQLEYSTQATGKLLNIIAQHSDELSLSKDENMQIQEIRVSHLKRILSLEDEINKDNSRH